LHQGLYPIARCPNEQCRCVVLYSTDPKEKSNVIVKVDKSGSTGLLQMCPRCKTLYSIYEKPKVAKGYVALPIINANH